MNLQLRPAVEAEWPICRMLLPETFGDAEGRTYLLYVREEAPRVVAAVSFVRNNEAISKLRMHVVPPFRRRGFGSQIIAQLAQMNASALEGVCDVIKEPGTEDFCTRNGFRREEWLTTVEVEITAMLAYLDRLSKRLGGSSDAQIVPLSAAPMQEVAQLHAEHVAQLGTLSTWRWRFAQTPGMGISPVAMIDDRVAGILLGELQGTTAIVHTRVMHPEHRGAWTSTALLHAGLVIAGERGAQRVRFSYVNTNHDTEKMAKRFGAETVSVAVRFRREL